MRQWFRLAIVKHIIQQLEAEVGATKRNWQNNFNSPQLPDGTMQTLRRCPDYSTMNTGLFTSLKYGRNTASAMNATVSPPSTTINSGSIIACHAPQAAVDFHIVMKQCDIEGTSFVAVLLPCRPPRHRRLARPHRGVHLHTNALSRKERRGTW